jgi:hypothetical protein
MVNAAADTNEVSYIQLTVDGGKRRAVVNDESRKKPMASSHSVSDGFTVPQSCKVKTTVDK